MTAKPRHHDPAPSERVYYRHAETGDLGYVVWRDGEERIKYDLANQDRVVPFKRGTWLPETRHAPLTVASLARVAYAADGELCRQLGLHGESKLEWLSLSENKRIAFAASGPRPEPPVRLELFAAIMRTLGGLAK